MNFFSPQVFMNHLRVFVPFIVTPTFSCSCDLHLNTKHECAIKMFFSKRLTTKKIFFSTRHITLMKETLVGFMDINYCTTKGYFRLFSPFSIDHNSHFVTFRGAAADRITNVDYWLKEVNYLLSFIDYTCQTFFRLHT